MDAAPTQPVLGAIGISDVEERVYRLLIDQPGASAAELARRAALSGPIVRRVLRSLQERGLASSSPAPASAFFAAPPEVAVTVLLNRRQHEIELARVAAARLQDAFRSAMERRTSPGELVEVATGREAYGQRFMQLQRLARTQVRILDKPPYADSGPSVPNVLELESLGRGLRYRTIYDRAAFEVQGFFEEFEQLVTAGEEARTHPSLPMKLAVADETLALIPLRVRDDDMAGLIVHASPLLDGVIGLFELLWERSAPIHRATPSAAAAGSATGLSADDRATLLLMAAGVTDDAAALQLGIAQRTFSRRIKRVMQQLGVTTRFQAGMEAARREWL